MKKVTLVFPGQGSQYVGMGKNIDSQLLKKADSILGYSLSHIMNEGPEEKLKETQNTQPAILAHSFDLFQKLKSKNIQIEKVLGHSVGEYAALVATNVLSFEDAVKAVHWRGKFMQEATPIGVGKMVAILKLDESWINKACEAASTSESKVMPANFNDPKQIVISGHAQACEKAVEWLNQNCTEKFGAIPLAVSAPFHSSLMRNATVKMKDVLAKINFNSNHHPYIANIDAKIYPSQTDGNIIKENLLKQIEGAVRWTQSIEQLQSDTLFLEVGPGKVLTGLIKRIKPEAICLPLDQEASWVKLEEMIK